jgi:hypothetical protein
MKTVRRKLSTQVVHALQLFGCLSQLASEEIIRAPRQPRDDDRVRDIDDMNVLLQFFAPMIGDSYGIRRDIAALKELRDRRPTRIPCGTAHEKRAARDWPVQCALIWANLGAGCLLRIIDDAASPAAAAAHVSIRNQLDLIDGAVFFSSSFSQPLRDYVAGLIGASYVQDDVTDQGPHEWAESVTKASRGIAVAS